MQTSPGAFRRFFGALWSGIDLSRRIVINGLFLLLVLVVIAALFAPSKQTVPKGAALIVSPAGELVEQLDDIDPVAALLGTDDNKPPQTLLTDLVDAVNNAKDDARISALVIATADLHSASSTQLAVLRKAITDFKTSGKKVYAMADYYSQPQYLLASVADEIYMGPQGTVVIEGFSRYRMFFKSALDKLGVNLHVFRVGTYKSAVEPYLRDDMSPEDKEASQAFLGELWSHYKAEVSQSRRIKPEAVEAYVNDFVTKLKAVKGNSTQLALDAKLIDGLKSRDEWRDYMMGIVGKDKEEKSYKHITYHDYLSHIRPPVVIPDPSADKIALLVAKGEIRDGEQPAGTIGGDTLSQLIRRAREDKSVKALVLRVDSPGGSAFASEVIRRELEITQKAGKPVVVSMGTYAASGGYWISATSDQIWAEPTTITGSIGIYGMFPTIDKPLNNWGIYSDGVGTTKFAGSADMTRPLNPELAEVIQQVINHGYDEFLNLVARGRNKTPEQVDAVAQGHVWTGAKALELGLVDKLGGLDQAIAAAAKLAKLDNYELLTVEKELTPKEQFLRNLTSNAAVWLDLDLRQEKARLAAARSPASLLVNKLRASVDQVFTFNDPQHAYVHCLCEVN